MDVLSGSRGDPREGCSFLTGDVRRGVLEEAATQLCFEGEGIFQANAGGRSVISGSWGNINKALKWETVCCIWGAIDTFIQGSNMIRFIF